MNIRRNSNRGKKLAVIVGRTKNLSTVDFVDHVFGLVHAAFVRMSTLTQQPKFAHVRHRGINTEMVRTCLRCGVLLTQLPMNVLQVDVESVLMHSA